MQEVHSRIQRRAWTLRAAGLQKKLVANSEEADGHVFGPLTVLLWGASRCWCTEWSTVWGGL